MKEIIELVAEMRNAQREYFKTRDYEVLRKSKALEKRVDSEIAEYRQNIVGSATASLFQPEAMSIYINKRTGGYGYTGGMAIVAARSEAEAQKILTQNLEWAEDYYDPNTWQKLENVETNMLEPQLIAESGYTE